MRKACWAVILCFLAALPARAREIYVDNLAGDDKNTGLHAVGLGDPLGPVRTIARAMRLAFAGDRVILTANAEPYHECVSLVGTRRSGAAEHFPFVLDGSGATLDGAAPIPDDAWRFYRDNIFRFRPRSLAGAMLFAEGRAIPPRPVSSATDLPPRLAPGEWSAIEGVIYFAVDPQRLPSDYKLSYAALPTGVTLYQVDQVVVRNLKIRGFQADGICAAVGARNVVLENIAASGNGRSGICVQGGGQATLVGCKLAGNGEAQVLTRADSETYVSDCELTADTAPKWLNGGGRVYGQTAEKPTAAGDKGPGDKGGSHGN